MPVVRRIPVVPTIVVALAVAAMIGLGLWQLLDRLPRKEAFLAQLDANPAKPPIAFPATPDDRLLFRRSRLDCRPPVAVRLAGAGAAGYRAIATCAGESLVQLGTTRDPNASISWSGGIVQGRISHAPDGRSLIGSLFDRSPRRLLLVASAPPAGLSAPLTANGTPDATSVPNSHLAYAGQWFFFAAIAAIVYALALKRRVVVPTPPSR